MRDYIENAITGCLGRSAKSWQKTLKRKAGQLPWCEVRISVQDKVFVSFSLDGRTYTEEMILDWPAETVFYLAVRAVRVRVSRACDHVCYTVVCRD